MPCTYIETAEEIAARQDKAKKALLAPVQKQLRRVTRLLCGALTAFEDQFGEVSDLSVADLNIRKDLLAWWAQHKQDDVTRQEEARQKARQKALSKLSVADRKALGLQ